MENYSIEKIYNYLNGKLNANYNVNELQYKYIAIYNSYKSRCVSDSLIIFKVESLVKNNYLTTNYYEIKTREFFFISKSENNLYKIDCVYSANFENLPLTYIITFSKNEDNNSLLYVVNERYIIDTLVEIISSQKSSDSVISKKSLFPNLLKYQKFNKFEESSFNDILNNACRNYHTDYIIIKVKDSDSYLVGRIDNISTEKIDLSILYSRRILKYTHFLGKNWHIKIYINDILNKNEILDNINNFICYNSNSVFSSVDAEDIDGYAVANKKLKDWLDSYFDKLPLCEECYE